MNPTDPWQLVQAASQVFLDPLKPIFLLMMVLTVAMYGAGWMIRILDRDHRNPFEIPAAQPAEKPKRSLSSLAGEKPKRIIGDDGELFHPIDEYFYDEDSEDA